MTKRMRYYIKRGWVVIELPGNPFTVSNYHGARSWCEQMFGKDTWVARLTGGSADSKFAFRNESDATLFSLKWLTE